MKDKNLLIKIFLSTFYLSAFTFGGGYVIISLMKNKFVDELKFLEEDEMLDLVAIAQSAPGPIAINGAIVVGYKLAGLIGVIVSVLGAVIPPFLIITIISFFYDIFKNNIYINQMLLGMKSGVSAVIISVVYDMGKKITDSKDGFQIIIMIFSFILSYFYKINVMYIVISMIIFGIIKTLYTNRKDRK